MQSTLAFFNLYNMSLDQLSNKKNLLINTINAHSFNISQNDSEFKMALNKSDVLLPDGISIVFAMRFLKGLRLH